MATATHRAIPRLAASSKVLSLALSVASCLPGFQGSGGGDGGGWGDANAADGPFDALTPDAGGDSAVAEAAAEDASDAGVGDSGDVDGSPCDATGCSKACVDLQSDPGNCGSCGHSCAPGLCSAGHCQAWLAAQAVTPGAGVTSLSTDGTYLAWYDGSATRCQVVSVSAAVGGSASPSTFASATSPASGYPASANVAVAKGVVACLLQETSGPELWYRNGSGGSALTIPLTGGDVGYATGLAMTTTGTIGSGFGGSAYFNNALSSAPAKTTNVYRCLLASGSQSCFSLGTYAGAGAVGDLLIDGASLIVAEGGNGTVGALSLVDDTWSSPATGQGTVDLLASDATDLYWVGGSLNLSVNRLPLGNLSATPQVLLSSYSLLATAIASDGTNVYFGGSTSGGTSSGWIGSVPVGGASSPSQLFSLSGNIVTGLVVTGATLFWTEDGDGRLMGVRL